MFANSKETVMKWVMNRPSVSKFNEAIEDMCSLSKSATNSYKCLRQSEIQKSNRMVNAIVETLHTHFIIPFREELDTDKLYNIVSGAPTSEVTCEGLVKLQKTGKLLKDEFETESCDGKSSLFSNIKQNKSSIRFLQFP